jgi:hypothetical protein
VVGLVVWLHILLGPYWCVCSALFQTYLALARRPRTILLSSHPILQENFNYLSVSIHLCSPNYFVTCNSPVKILHKTSNFQSSKAATKQQAFQGKPTNNQCKITHQSLDLLQWKSLSSLTWHWTCVNHQSGEPLFDKGAEESAPHGAQ